MPSLQPPGVLPLSAASIRDDSHQVIVVRLSKVAGGQRVIESRMQLHGMIILSHAPQ